MVKKSKITPHLWFTPQAWKLSEVTDYYKNIFWEDFISEDIVSLGNTPWWYTEMVEVSLFKTQYMFLSTSQKHNDFNDAFSLIIHCKNQEEIDRYWDYFTTDWRELECGWCKDKYWLRWQIIPENIKELMNKPDAWKVMMKQKKIVIDEY